MTVRPITKWILAAIALVGLLLRLSLVTNDGFHNDVMSFISWAGTASSQPLWEFYQKAGFADYPPGYLYVLAAIGHFAAIFHLNDTASMVVLVKLPAILCDLLIGLMLFNLCRRYVCENWALGIAAFYLLNPATILIAALWGQVESVGGSLALLSIFLLIKAQDDAAPPRWYVPVSWLCLSASLLMKPEAAILLVLLVAYPFADREHFAERVRATLIGAGASLLLALISTLPFHPTVNVVGAFEWLIERYRYGTSIYAVSSVNAFNLWSITKPFWQPDSQLILGIPQWFWGIVLQLAATGLVLWRYLQVKTTRALLESAALLLLAFFLLNTRMHERYLYDGFLFTIACAAFAWRYRIAAIALTVTFFANLEYSLYYLRVFDQHIQTNAMDLWGAPDHLLSLVNVATFFVLGYAFLGGEGALGTSPLSGNRGAVSQPPAISTEQRSWFDPAQGLQSFQPIDYVVSGALGVASFVLSFVNYWLPHKEIFDEIYFARAGEEYLKHIAVYETTHPPLTKLIIAGSMLLFGGLHGWGDTPVGWRFVNVVCGALVVMLLYAFARRVTGSTIFAAIAAGLLGLDGMHFVQSRIATPEGIVIVFSLAAVYAFYRFWIASQVNERQLEDENSTVAAVGAATISLAVGLFGSFAIDAWYFHQSFASAVVIGLYASVGLYLLARLVVNPRIAHVSARELSYGEGSYAIRAADGTTTLYTADGGEVDSNGKTPRRGRRSQSRGNALVYKDGDLEIAYGRDACVTYQTPDGSAVYTAQTVVAGDSRQRGKDATFWLLTFTVALGCLIASKWYGVMSFGVSTCALVLIWAQRFKTRPFDVSNGIRWDLITYGAIGALAVAGGWILNAWFDALAPALVIVAGLAWLQGFTGFEPRVWGNPRGFRLDIALCTIVFVAATVYGLVYVPEFVRQLDIKNPTDMIYRQYSMFEYHDHLIATHPYASVWWVWPLDGRPVAYYYNDGRADKSDPNAGPVEEILSLPNPAILWFGLLSVPFVGVLAWLRRNKGYALIVLTYLLQWLPWMKSPRIAFAYHFYVDIPLICLCNAIALQWVWERWKDKGSQARLIAGASIGVYVALVAAAFVWFYPILAGVGLTWNAWDARMWHSFMGNHWI